MDCFVASAPRNDEAGPYSASAIGQTPSFDGFAGFKPGNDGFSIVDGISMQLSGAKFCLILTLTLAVSACAQRSQISVSTLGEDDDAICRANNALGSSEYIACRRDRDVLRNNAAGRADRRQRDLGEYMMNHPDHP
jgi:hypothetical protein